MNETSAAPLVDFSWASLAKMASITLVFALPIAAIILAMGFATSTENIPLINALAFLIYSGALVVILIPCWIFAVIVTALWVNESKFLATVLEATILLAIYVVGSGFAWVIMMAMRDVAN